MKMFIIAFVLKLRKILYSLLSRNKNVINKPITIQATLLMGKGQIIFGEKVSLGYLSSPNLFNGSIYIEARQNSASIEFGKNIIINNNFTAICEKTRIKIGDNCLIGHNVEIYDSDFHNIEPSRRLENSHLCKEVIIGNNVFIGANVKLLKGVTIGNNSVVALGTIVTRSFPENVVIGGNPAKILKTINEYE
jgi:acetyltransferase-like isoleucine patch superfamily enzyme